MDSWIKPYFVCLVTGHLVCQWWRWWRWWWLLSDFVFLLLLVVVRNPAPQLYHVCTQPSQPQFLAARMMRAKMAVTITMHGHQLPQKAWLGRSRTLGVPLQPCHVQAASILGNAARSAANRSSVAVPCLEREDPWGLIGNE